MEVYFYMVRIRLASFQVASWMTSPLLQLISVAKIFDALRALEDMSLELRAHAPGQPGGLPDISRGLSAATPPVPIRNRNRTPEGCQNRLMVSRSSVVVALWHPSGVREIHLSTDRGYRRCAPQPPANVWQPSGLRHA